MSLGHADLRASSSYFLSAAEMSLTESDMPTYCLSLVGKAWVSFISGNRMSAQDSLDQVCTYVSSVENVTLHLWALELDVLMKCFTRDFDGIDESVKMMKLLLRRGGGGGLSQTKRSPYTAPASCLIAFAFSKNNQFDKALYMGIDAVSKMSSRKQACALGVLIMFFGAYALQDVLDARKGSHANSGGNKSSGHSTEKKRSYMMGTMNQIEAISTEEITAVVRNAANSLVQHSQRFPCLSPFVWFLQARMLPSQPTPLSQSQNRHRYRLPIEPSNSPIRPFLRELDEFIRSNDKYLAEFSLAAAYLHYHRTLLRMRCGLDVDDEGGGLGSRPLGASSSTSSSWGRRGREEDGSRKGSGVAMGMLDSRPIATASFSALGGCPEVSLLLVEKRRGAGDDGIAGGDRDRDRDRGSNRSRSRRGKTSGYDSNCSAISEADQEELSVSRRRGNGNGSPEKEEKEPVTLMRVDGSVAQS